MYILGINGWGERSHDASACLIKDGRIVTMAEEERFIRKKHAYDSLPLNSCAYCLSKAKINLDEVELVAIGWDLPKHYQLRKIDFPKKNQEIAERFFPKKYFKYTRFPRIIFVPHHLAHAASSFYTSGFKSAAILVIDGQGEEQSTSLFLAKDGKIKLIKQFRIEDSLGYMYEAACKMIGLKTEDGGKLMGLAPYGNAKKFQFDFIKLKNDGYSLNIGKKISLKNSIDEQEELIKSWHSLWFKKFALVPKQSNYDFIKNNFAKKTFAPTKQDKDFAAATQDALEKTILHLVSLLKNKTKYKNLVLSGGVALNCSTNGKILNSRIFKNVYLFPAVADNGVSLGAALYLYFKDNPFKPRQKINTAAWGPEYSNNEIKKILDKYKIKYRHSKNIAKDVAEMISQGKIIGWFQGRMEIGPRALGNRSIIADPRIKNNHTIVNNIKGRENWRPLAPSILSGKEKKYFKNRINSPFMLFAFKIRKGVDKKIPAVVHIDGSARPQSVDKSNRKYYDLINEFCKITEIPLVLNTSFNLKDEPIVCRPIDAIRTFYSSRLDGLAIEDFIIKK